MKRSCWLTVGLVAVFLGVALLDPAARAASFKRGDANADGGADLSDAVKILNVLFLGTAKNDCDDAADTNDDGTVDISDGVYVLNYLFLGGAIVPPPFPDCGVDATNDSLTCNTYALCVDCFRESDLDALLATVPGETCIPAGATELVVGEMTISVCPTNLASQCGDPPAAGCPILIQEVSGTLNIPAREVRLHLQGQAVDLPIVVTSTGPFGGTTTCSTDIQFEGDAVVPFTVSDNGDGTLTILVLGDPTILDPVIDLSATGGALCTLFASLKDLFVGELVTQLEQSAGDLLNDIRPEIEGKILCP